MLMQPEMAGSGSSTKPDFAVWLLPSIKSGSLLSLAQGRSINSVPTEGPPSRGPESNRSSTESRLGYPDPLRADSIRAFSSYADFRQQAHDLVGMNGWDRGEPPVTKLRQPGNGGAIAWNRSR